MRSRMLDNGPEGSNPSQAVLEIFLFCPMNLVQRWIIWLKSDRCECVFLCCCYGHWLLFISLFCLSFFLKFPWANLRLCVSAQASGHLIWCLCTHTCTFGSCFPSSLPLSLRTSLGIRNNLVRPAAKLSQGHPDPQFLPPSDKKLMSWHTCEVGQTFKNQSGDFQLCFLTLLVSPAVM